MRTGLAMLVTMLIGVASATPAGAATETVTGQVVDLACYMLDKGNTGHPSRPRLCVCAGLRQGRLSGRPGDGRGQGVSRIWRIGGQEEREARPAHGHVVTVTGEVTQKDNTTVISSDDLRMVRAASQER